MTLWLRVSKDCFEFPEVVADSVEELAELCGVSVNTIRSTISHAKGTSHQLRRSKYVMVEIEEDEDAFN